MLHSLIHVLGWLAFVGIGLFSVGVAWQAFVVERRRDRRCPYCAGRGIVAAGPLRKDDLGVYRQLIPCPHCQEEGAQHGPRP